jgi:hypothetical protein
MTTATTIPEKISPSLIPPTLKLTVTRAQASRDIQAQIKIGQAIKNQRVREQRDLEEARDEKNQWMQRTSDLLLSCFNHEAVAEQWLDFHPQVLPEYAEFQLFIDLFVEEMRQRIARLYALLEKLAEIPEPSIAGAVAQQLAHPQIDIEPATQSAPKSMTAPTQTAPARTIHPATPLKAAAKPATPRLANAAAAVAVRASSATSAIKTPMTNIAIIQRGAADAESEPVRSALIKFLEKLGLKLLHIDAATPVASAMEKQQGLGYALILSSDPAQPPPLFDLGFCVGRLGLSRVCIVHSGNGQCPTEAELHGASRVSLDSAETDGWQLPLARQLRKGGVEVDLNKLL